MADTARSRECYFDLAEFRARPAEVSSSGYLWAGWCETLGSMRAGGLEEFDDLAQQSRCLVLQAGWTLYGEL